MKLSLRILSRLPTLLIFVFFVLGPLCSHPVFAAERGPEVKEESETRSFQLQPGGRLEIVVYREEDLSGVYEIDPVGRLSFPLIGEIQVGGLEVEEFRKQLVESLKKYLVNPQVSISRAEASIKSISVLGHVKTPGVYDYVPGSTLMRLISTAGGFAESANKKKIKVVRMIQGKKKTIVINGLDIVDGKKNDPNIEPGDIIFVPESVF